jgi:hypothetical protein
MTLAQTTSILFVLFVGVVGDIAIGSSTMKGGMHHRWKVIKDEQQRHPLEDITSWELHQQRTQQHQQPSEHRRQLAEYVTVTDDEDADTPYIIKHKKPKSHIPFAGGDTTHGMMIDAYVTKHHLFLLLLFCVCFATFILPSH